ncbi:2-oxoglutarate and iron-dependent oxygenase JMJD4 [Halyomorpha halys]|uniref:2-oxoglutarate and iron-dependent oxygenase JMJD4 n=1 Tax=Halyomorpha halys TaxID=286706 RepID=UPI0006D5200B|nr:jmjC domain-containing protein 4 [Halyomorpha halys]
MLVDLENKYLVSENVNVGNGIKTLNCEEIVYSDFYRHFLHQNVPCIIKNLTSDWECQRMWVLNNKPNLEYLDSHFGNASVPVANCNEKYYNSHAKTTMLFRDFISYWHKYTRFPDSNQCLYLKDWHFLREFPDYEIYHIPLMFASDWLNEYLLSRPDSDDYRFVYLGPKGSWTPLHADVFSSFSWSVNICGRKKWVFFPPGEEFNLKDKFGELVYSVESEDLKDNSLYPNYKNLVKPYILIQEVGDAIFVPSEWHHQVWNLEDTISINHNWINACNIRIVWKDLLNNLNKIKREIADCKDMEDWDNQCQLILKSVFGMDINEFLNFIFYIADVRLKSLDNDDLLKLKYSSYCFGKNHIIHDLLSLSDVLNSIKENSLGFENMNKIINLIDRIKTFK